MLLHIGYHKTATTWLQQSVFSEPLLGFVQPWDSSSALQAIALAPAFGFDAEEVRRSLPSRWSDQDGQELVAVLSHERFSGIPYTGGHDSETILDRLHAVFPHAKVLVTVREQCNVVWSAYRQYVLDGGAETIKQWLCPPKVGSGMATRFHPDFYRYERLVGAYHDRFGADRVLVLPYEMLAVDRLGYIDRVRSFTSAPLVEAGRERVRELPPVNVSMSGSPTTLKRLANLVLIRTWLNPAAPVDAAGLNYVAGRVLQRIDRRVAPRRSSSPVPDIVRRALAGRYVTSNRALGQLIGMDLSRYGYQWEHRAEPRR